MTLYTDPSALSLVAAGGMEAIGALAVIAVLVLAALLLVIKNVLTSASRTRS